MSQDIIIYDASPALIHKLIEAGHDVAPANGEDPQGSIVDGSKDEDLEFLKENFTLVQIRELRRMGEFFKLKKTWL